MENSNETHKQQRPISTISSWVAAGISFICLLLSMYATLRTVGKEKIEINTYDYLGFCIRYEQIFINPYISLKNYGKSTGTISSIEAFIVSKARDTKGNPKYMRHFSDIFYESDRINPFLGCFVYPNDNLTIDAIIDQKNTNGFGSFDSGAYEYLLILKDDKERSFPPLCYEFDIEPYQVKRIFGKNMTYIKLTPSQEKDRNILLETFELFKNPTADFNIGNDENDLKSGFTFTITFDPNGGEGGNGSQTFIAGSNIGVPLDGGIPTLSGHKFSHWTTNRNNSWINDNIWHNGLNTNPSSDAVVYAVWVKDF